MKCTKCGYYNKSNKHYCEKCGNALDNQSPVRQYKQKAKENDPRGFNTAEKIIIGASVIILLMLILSAAIPSDMDFSNIIPQDNNTQEESPIITENDEKIKLNTRIEIESIGVNEANKILISAYVTDENNAAVTSGTTSVTIKDIKYSGQVENGNVNIQIPDVTEEQEVVVNYEGNSEYNPSQTTATIQLTKQNTRIDTEIIDNIIIATLKTDNDQQLENSTIKVTYSDNTNEEKTTDNNGKISINLDELDDINQIKLSYEGSQLYNACQKTIEIKQEKEDTKLETEYDQFEKLAVIKLTDNQNNPVKDAKLIVTMDDKEQVMQTDDEGKIKLDINQGLNEATIKYDGNQTLNPSETNINMIIEENDTENTTTQDTNEKDTTQNLTDDQNNTILADDVSYDENTTNDENITENNTNVEKINTTVKADKIEENDTIILNITTVDDEILSYEDVIIKLDDGQTIKEKTDENGTITLNMTEYDDIDKIEVIYEGNDLYSSFDEFFRI